MAKNEAMPEKEPSILLLSFIALWILVSILLAFQDVDLTTYPGTADRLEEWEPVKIEPQLVET